MFWVALITVISLVLPTPAAAIIYQCRDEQGTLFLTDDPDNLPPGCKDRQTRLQKKDVKLAPTAPTAPTEAPGQRTAPAEERAEDEEKSPQTENGNQQAR